MAAAANAYQRTNVSNELEDFSPLIFDVSPEETPLVTNAAKGTATNPLFDWTEDTLDAPDGNNAWIDGDVFAAQTVTPPTKLSNESQISRKDFRVTRRARKIAKTGQTDELARQAVRKGRELRRDMETILCGNQAKVADNGTVAPRTASVLAWITGGPGAQSRVDRGATGADPAGDGTNAATDGTARALTAAGLETIQAGIYEGSQEMPDCIMLGIASKRNFSNYMFGANAKIATPYQDHGANAMGGVTVVGAVDVWVGDYVTLDIVPNRFMRAQDAIFCNFGYIELKFFDPISTDVMAKDADDDSRMVLADYGLCVRNRATLGTFADIDPALAMVA